MSTRDYDSKVYMTTVMVYTYLTLLLLIVGKDDSNTHTGLRHEILNTWFYLSILGVKRRQYFYTWFDLTLVLLFIGKDGSKVTTVVATPGQGSDRPQEVSYTDTKVIGNGSFGVVYQAKLCETNELVAIKKVLQDKRFKVSSYLICSIARSRQQKYFTSDADLAEVLAMQYYYATFTHIRCRLTLGSVSSSVLHPM